MACTHRHRHCACAQPHTHKNRINGKVLLFFFLFLFIFKRSEARVNGRQIIIPHPRKTVAASIITIIIMKCAAGTSNVALAERTHERQRPNDAFIYILVHENEIPVANAYAHTQTHTHTQTLLTRLGVSFAIVE